MKTFQITEVATENIILLIIIDLNWSRKLWREKRQTWL